MKASVMAMRTRFASSNPYTPSQYKSSESAALMFLQDGHTYVDENGQAHATALDNLIIEDENPITIEIFMNPGVFHKKF
jgi:enterochelin esterase-like enzyme